MWCIRYVSSDQSFREIPMLPSVAFVYWYRVCGDDVLLVQTQLMSENLSPPFDRATTRISLCRFSFTNSGSENLRKGYRSRSDKPLSCSQFSNNVLGQNVAISVPSDLRLLYRWFAHMHLYVYSMYFLTNYSSAKFWNCYRSQYDSRVSRVFLYNRYGQIMTPNL